MIDSSLLSPDQAARWHTAWTAYQAGDLQQASELLHALLLELPEHDAMLHILGKTQWKLGQLQQARLLLSRAVELNPEEPLYQYHLGEVLLSQEMPQAALMQWQQLISSVPTFRPAYLAAARCLSALGQAAQARSLLEAGLRVLPDAEDLVELLALTYLRHNQSRQAITLLRHSLKRFPLRHGLHVHLASAYHQCGQYRQALQTLDTLLTLVPDHYVARYQRGVIRLSVGDYANGWHDYDARLMLPGVLPEVLPFTPWQGEDLTERTLLVLAHESVESALLLSRFIPILRAAAQPKKLYWFGDASLFPLLANFGIDHCIADAKELATLACDYAVPLASVPRIFQLRSGHIPAPSIPLSIDAPVAQYWRARLEGHVSHVGIALYAQRMAVYPQPDFLAQVLSLAGLNYIDCVPPLLADARDATDVSDALTAFDAFDGLPVMQVATELKTLAQTAALMQQLDYFISYDNVLAVLASCLKIPTIVLLPHAPSWYWGAAVAQSAWFPTTTLLRLPASGDWSQVAAQLQTMLETRSS